MTNKIKTEMWNCNDPRLPKNNDIVRTPPDEEFMYSIVNNQLQPILMCHDPNTDEWFIGFGRKRLLAVRMANEKKLKCDHIWVRIEEATREDADLFTLIENAQRSSNRVGDYIVIKHILFSDPTASYRSIAKSIGKKESYVKDLDRKFAEVPDWALNAVKNEDIVENVAISLGKLNPADQHKCREHLIETKKLPQSFVSETKRFTVKNAVASMTMALDDSINQPGQEYFGRPDVEKILELLNEKKYSETKKFVVELLSY